MKHIQLAGIIYTHCYALPHLSIDNTIHKPTLFVTIHCSGQQRYELVSKVSNTETSLIPKAGYEVTLKVKQHDFYAGFTSIKVSLPIYIHVIII